MQFRDRCYDSSTPRGEKALCRNGHVAGQCGCNWNGTTDMRKAMECFFRRCAGIGLPLLLCCFLMETVMAEPTKMIALPEPDRTGTQALESLLRQRRSVRDYTDTPLSLHTVSQLLWAAQGITHPRGLRTAPSAGALYPLEVYLVAGRVDGLPAGVYHYRPDDHRLKLLHSGDLRDRLAQAAVGQAWLADGSVTIVFAAVYDRTARKYGQRAARYVHVEAGHAAQNLFLQAVALQLGTVVVGAFDDKAVAGLLRLPDDVQPLLLMPVGCR
jgi:SagB-type dehydrogenase family enzyme